MDMQVGARILARIEREQYCTRSRLTAFCNLTGAQLDAAAKGLEAEGKIKIWPGIRTGSFIYSLPAAVDPRGEKPAPKTAGTKPVAAKSQSNVKQRQSDTSRPKPAAADNPSPKNGGGRTGSAEAPAALKGLFEIDLRFVGMLQERAGYLMRAIAAESPIDGELLDLFCLTTDWLRERRASA